MSMLNKAVDLVHDKLLKSSSESGSLDAEHCFRLSRDVIAIGNKYSIGLDGVIVAILHDILCNTGVTVEYLQREGFNNNIIEAIVALTQKPNELFSDYIDRVSKNRIAMIVKMKDLIIHMDLSNVEGAADNVIEQSLMYMRAYSHLGSILKEFKK